MTDLAELKYRPGGCSAGPCFYRGSFTATNAGDAAADTFLDTAGLSGLSKGFVWVNGRPLGRDWKIGPQQTLYLPGVWLKAGANEAVVFDLGGPVELTLRGLNKPILDAPVKGGT